MRLAPIVHLMCKVSGNKSLRFHGQVCYKSFYIIAQALVSLLLYVQHPQEERDCAYTCMNKIIFFALLTVRPTNESLSNNRKEYGHVRTDLLLWRLQKKHIIVFSCLSICLRLAWFKQPYWFRGLRSLQNVYNIRIYNRKKSPNLLM